MVEDTQQRDEKGGKKNEATKERDNKIVTEEEIKRWKT